MNSVLEMAITIAIKAHSGQVDKGGEPYILHLLRVMLAAKNTEEKIVAVLHDVLEDSVFTSEDLENYGTPKHLVQVIEVLTRGKLDVYSSYIEHISYSKFASGIKILDLKDNLDLSRLSSISPKDISRNEKYKHALELLVSANK